MMTYHLLNSVRTQSNLSITELTERERESKNGSLKYSNISVHIVQANKKWLITDICVVCSLAAHKHYLIFHVT